MPLQEKRQQEAAAKKLEAKRLAAEEEKEMANLGKKKPAAKATPSKARTAGGQGAMAACWEASRQ